jgi:hypothetical protein
VVGAGVAGGRNVVEGTRRPVLGVLGVGLLAGVGSAPVLFRVLPIGSSGRATVGGPLDGREGLGSAVDMLMSGFDWPANATGPSARHGNPAQIHKATAGLSKSIKQDGVAET